MKFVLVRVFTRKKYDFFRGQPRYASH